MPSSIQLDTDLNAIGRDDFTAFFDEYLNESNVREQTVVAGTVLNIDSDWVTVEDREARPPG